MSYHVSIPTRLLYDKTIRDVDLRLYLIIAENTNSKGYSEISNEKLQSLSGKAKRSIQESLNALEEAEHIFIIRDVKKSELYPANKPRVIWLNEPYRAMKAKKRYEAKQNKEKTAFNDFNVFVALLRDKFLNVPFNVTGKNGVIEMFSIRISEERGEEKRHLWNMTTEPIRKLKSKDANDIFRTLWKNRAIVLGDGTGAPLLPKSKGQEEFERKFEELRQRMKK